MATSLDCSSPSMQQSSCNRSPFSISIFGCRCAAMHQHKNNSIHRTNETPTAFRTPIPCTDIFSSELTTGTSRPNHFAIMPLVVQHMQLSLVELQFINNCMDQLVGCTNQKAKNRWIRLNYQQCLENLQTLSKRDFLQVQCSSCHPMNSTIYLTS